LNYVPSLPGNALYLGIFVVLLAAQIGLSIRWKTWAFLVGMVFGLGLEIVGYVGRIMMHANVFKKNNFLMRVTYPPHGFRVF
jgi:RTA1 like protein